MRKSRNRAQLTGGDSVKAEVADVYFLKGAVEVWEVLKSTQAQFRVIGTLDSDWQASVETTQPICQVQ